MLEVETEEGQKDSVFGDLDCNDNTPVLQPEIDQQNCSNEMSPTKSPGIISSPIRSPSRSSNMSDQPPATGQSAIPGLLYSPEDTLNNDFFYDDEFSVPFDANLTEAEMKMLDSIDLNTILRLSKQHLGDDNVKWHEPKMSSSKSDTCLYQPDPDLSDSEREMDTSGEGERGDIISSSELSDFKSEPLFSPPPEFDESGAASTTDSMSRDELSGSYSLREEPRYNYDWRANKDQYMLSFDRSPSKLSDCSAGRTPTPDGGGITGWAQRSVTASQTSWGSVARRGGGGDTNSGSMYNSGGGGYGSGSASGRSPQKSSTGSSASTMMTWRQVKETSSPDSSVDGGLTTWKTLRDECHQCRDDNSTGTRSKSLPDLKANQAGAEEGARSVVTDCGDDERRQHSARTLLELFQRSRSREEEAGFPPSVSMEAGCEAMISPTSLHQLAGTWSLSPVHSDGSYATAPQTVSGHSTTSPPIPTSPYSAAAAGLISWNTIKYLTAPHRGGLVDTSTQVSICSDLEKPKGLDLSVQCAPALTDCAVQTSFVDRPRKAAPPSVTSRSLQTSVSMGEITPIPAVRVVHRSQSQPAKGGAQHAREQSPPELVVQLSARARERMSRSAYFVSRGGLPDLSFLNMSQSVASTPSPKSSLHSSSGGSLKSSVDDNMAEEKGKFKDFKKLYSIGRRRKRSEEEEDDDEEEDGGKVPRDSKRPFTREQLEMLKRHQQALHQMERVKILEEHSRRLHAAAAAGDTRCHSLVLQAGTMRQSREGSQPNTRVSRSESQVAHVVRQIARHSPSRLSQIPRKPSRIPGKPSSTQSKGPPTLKKPQMPVKIQATAVPTPASPQHTHKAPPKVGPKPAIKPSSASRPTVPAKPGVSAKPRLLSKLPMPTKAGGSPTVAPPPTERLRSHEKSLGRVRRGEAGGDSRESSPGLSGSRRSRSTDSASTTNSFCSSSSSGIDPGSYESHHGHHQHHHHQHHHHQHQQHRSAHTPATEPRLHHEPRPARPLSVPADTRLYSYAPEDAGAGSDTSSDGSRRVREREYWGDTEESTGTGGRMSRKDSGLGFSQHKSPAALCSKCKEQINTNANSEEEEAGQPMTKSHPTYSKLVNAVEKVIPHTVEYLLVSPTRKPGKDRSSSCGHRLEKMRSSSLDLPGSSGKRLPPPKPPRCRGQLSLDETCSPRDSASENSDGTPRKPLKSCLVQRRKGERRGGSALKHRSWSDPFDGMVLKYSLNGEIKYQLVTHDAKCAWRHSTGDLPVQVVPGLGQLDEIPRADTQDTSYKLEIVTPVKEEPETPESPVTPVAEAETPPNSPEQIPIPTCACRTAHAVLHSSSDSSGSRAPSEEEALDMDGCGFTGPKKSVSFCEEVRFHSPHASPHPSPRKAKPLPGYCDQHNLVARHPISKDLLRARPKSLPQDLGLFPLGKAGTCIIDPIAEAPPTDFIVSPTREVAPAFPPSDSMIDLSHKREIVLDVIRAAEVILQHFSSTRDPEEKMNLGSTAAQSDIGELLLTHLCPAIHAMVLDGLNPHVRSLFGKVRNSAWKMIEDSADLGPSSRILNELVKDLKALDFLDTTWLKFNAFVFGLLNHKALDFWLSHIQSHAGLVSKHYSANSLFALSSSATKSLFLDMTTSLQPLAQLPFRLEYNFEFRVLKERHQRQMADYMLEKHVSQSADALIEGHQALQQRALGLDTSSTSSTSASLHVDLRDEVGKQALAIGKHTREYLQARGKQIFQKIQHGDLLHKEGGKPAGQVPRLRGINDSATITSSTATTSSTASTGSSVGSDSAPYMFYNSDTDSSTEHPAAAQAPTEEGPDSNAVQIIKNNELLGDLANSDIKPPPEGLFTRVKRQFKGFTVPAPDLQDKDVYKKGVTEYEFDTSPLSQAPKDGAAKTAESCEDQDAQAAGGGEEVQKRPKALFDDNGMPARQLPDAPEFQIPRRGSIKKDKTKYLSDSSSSSCSSSTPNTLRRWSSLGPKLIRAFDKLLLDSPVYEGRVEKEGKEGNEGTGICGVSRSTSMDSSKIPLPSSKVSMRAAATVKEEGAGSSSGSMNTARSRNSLNRVKSLDERLLKTDDVKVKKKPIKMSPSSPTTPIGSVKTLCHYVGTEDNQLSFEKGSILSLLKELDEDWLVCLQDKQKGLVHRACVKST